MIILLCVGVEVGFDVWLLDLFNSVVVFGFLLLLIICIIILDCGFWLRGC